MSAALSDVLLDTRIRSGIWRTIANLSRPPRRIYALKCKDFRISADHAEPVTECYCGNYTFDGARLITRVDAASDESRIGSDQVREVSFDGDRMILRPPPRQGDAGEEYRELTWERIAAE